MINKNEDVEGREAWIADLAKFREIHSLDAPTEEELASWRAEWATWNRRRRIQEQSTITTHLIISRRD